MGMGLNEGLYAHKIHFAFCFLPLTVSIQLFCQEAIHILLKCHIPRKQCDGAAVWEWSLLIKLKPRKIASSYLFN